MGKAVPRLLWSLCALARGLALDAGSLRAQAPNEFDFDTTQLVVTPIPPNGPTHVITTPVTYTGQNLTLHAPLTVRAGGELRLVRSVLRVFGDVLLEEGGRITVLDSSLLLPLQFQHQFDYRNEGGLLHTERAVIGTTRNGGGLYLTQFLNLRGTWLARQTVMQSMGVILADGRSGWGGNPAWKGGSVFAEGLYEGEGADAVHMTGMGDVVLVDGTANVGFYFDAAASGQPGAATVDLESRMPVTMVYGDAAVHAGVTSPIAAHPCRIELLNHRSPTWSFFANNVTTNGALKTVTLRNAEDIICNFRGTDLVGSPVLGGPWASHYGELPGLPSTTPPGFHAVPPACSVRLGNVQIQSGPLVSDWNRIRAWGLYSAGAGTDLSVTGPTHMAELRLGGGQMSLVGTGSFDMAVFCDVVQLFGNANLQIRNAALGQFGTFASVTGLIEANENSTCTITDTRTSVVRLKTTGPGASITGQNVFGAEKLILESGGGGSVQITSAAPSQNWDLQNSGFESPLLPGGLPPHWAASAVSGSLVVDAAPGSAGTRSFEFVGQAPGSYLRKALSLPPGTAVTVIGAAKVLQAPPPGSPLSLEMSQGASVRSATLGTALAGQWQRVHLPLFVSAALTQPSLLSFRAAGAPAAVRLDDVRVHVGSWWEDDNLLNLDMEMPCRDLGIQPDYLRAPDGWSVYQTSCVSDANVVRPGAAPGSRSVKATLRAASGNIYKNLTFLRPGDRVLLRGWVRGVSPNPGANIQVIIGNGANFYLVGFGPNQHSGPKACDGVWRQFQMTYLVPVNPSYTRIDLGTFDVAGTEAWFDDITVEVQPQ
jgi:hypothetical protein